MKKLIFVTLVSILGVFIKITWAEGAYEGKNLQDFVKTPEVIAAMKEFAAAFGSVRADNKMDSMDEAKKAVFEFYDGPFAKEYQESNGKAPDLTAAKNLDDDTIALQYYYIATNEKELGDKNHLTQANDSSAWTKAHAKYHSNIEKYTQDDNGLYDLFLVNLEGRIVYSVFKEIDFATQLIGGPYEKSELGETFKAVKESADKAFVKISKKAPFFPSYDGDSQFMGTAIYDGDTKIGVLIVQLPVW